MQKSDELLQQCEKRIINAEVDPRMTNDGSRWVEFYDDDQVCLDGTFTLCELEELVRIMKHVRDGLR